MHFGQIFTRPSMRPMSPTTDSGFTGTRVSLLTSLGGKAREALPCSQVPYGRQIHGGSYVWLVSSSIPQRLIQTSPRYTSVHLIVAYFARSLMDILNIDAMLEGWPAITSQTADSQDQSENNAVNIRAREKSSRKLRAACDGCHAAKTRCTGGTPCARCYRE